ncbi:unnamed protein product [Oikopleura dioica]|uniref:Uncharacterized protein n=1 Tax=Oikopleura dioica TaxID=34765 RepID=E4XMU9_OIKDI|nr:unnamed protein product [Oikopleura dioica]
MKRTSTPSILGFPQLQFNESVISDIANDDHYSFTAFSQNGSDWSILSLSGKSTASKKMHKSAKGLKKKITKKLRINKLKETMRNKLSKTAITEIMVPPNTAAIDANVSSRIRSAKELDSFEAYDIVVWEESLEEKTKFRIGNPFKRQKKSTEKLRHLKKNDGTLEIWRCEICTIEGKGFVLNSHTEHWVDNDSTFKCPASECAAVNQTFRDFFQSSCCEDNKRRKKDFAPLLANQNEEAEEGQLLNDIAAIELGGDSNGTAQKFRTRIVPMFSRDLTKWRWYDIKLNCYTAMYHAENKSLEELRIEDYISNRKVAEQLAIEKTNQGAVQNNNHPPLTTTKAESLKSG